MWVYAFFSTNPAERIVYLNGHDQIQALNFAKSLFSGQHSILYMYHHGISSRHLYFFSIGIYIFFYLICGKHLLLAYFLNICFFIAVFYILLYFGIKYILLYSNKHNIKLKTKKYTIVSSAFLFLVFSAITIISCHVKYSITPIASFFFLTFHTPATLISILSLVIVFKYFACHRGNNKKLRKYSFLLLTLLLAGTLFEDFFVLIFAIVPMFVASCIMFPKEKLKIILTKSTYLILFFVYLFYVGFTILIYVYFADRPLQLFKGQKDVPFHNYAPIILCCIVPLCMLIFFRICFSNIKIVNCVKNFFRGKNILFLFFSIFFAVSFFIFLLYVHGIFFASKNERLNEIYGSTRMFQLAVFVSVFFVTFLILRFNKVFLKYMSLLFVFVFSIYTIGPFVNDTKMPSIVFNVKNSYISCYDNYYKNILKSENVNTISSFFYIASMKLYSNDNMYSVNYLPNTNWGLGHLLSLTHPNKTTKINDFVYIPKKNPIWVLSKYSELAQFDNSKEHLTPKYSNTSYNGNKFLVAKCPGYTIYHSEKSFDRYTGYKIYNHFLPSGEQRIDFNAK